VLVTLSPLTTFFFTTSFSSTPSSLSFTILHFPLKPHHPVANMHVTLTTIVSIVAVAQVLPGYVLAAPLPHQAVEERSFKAIGSAIAGGLASLISGAAVKSAIGEREFEEYVVLLLPLTIF
jgi:hypothetical protein